MSISHSKVGKIKSGLFSIFICFICIFSSTHALPQTVLPQQIRIGTRTAAFPIGKVSSDGQISGFCGDAFEDGLRQELLNRGIQSSITNQNVANQYKGTRYPRYNGLITGKIEIECGPNSPSSGDLIDETTGRYFRDEISFSDPFHQTENKLILKVDQARRLHELPASEQEDEIYKLDIGVVKNTTTLKNFQEKGKAYTSYPTREEALDDLDAGSIEAYASDAIILQTLLERGVQGTELEKRRPPYEEEFILFPLKAKEYLPGLDEESFVIVVKKNTPYERELLDVINTTLSSIQNKNGLAEIEKDYVISDSNNPTSLSQGEADLLNTPESESDYLIVLGLFAVLGIVGIFTISIIALARGDIFHQHGTGDNVAGDKVRGDKKNSQNSNSRDKDA